MADGRLDEGEREELLRADLVLTRRRRTDQADVYVLVEVSSMIDPHDVDRARERASVLEKLGRPVVAVVGGRQINAEALQLARERSVSPNLEGQMLL